MKKSEYLERRKSHWLKYFQDPESVSSEDNVSGPAAQRANMDALAAEAAGVAWDPEGPRELPAHLIVVKTGQDMGRIAYRAANNATAELTLEELDEVKRRCEAWPKLERLVEAWEPSAFCNALRSILRGGLR